MATCTFDQARRVVIDAVTASGPRPAIEIAPLGEAAGRVLAQFAHADRDYPPVARSLRDGFAVRSADLPGALRVVGEVAAGGMFPGEVGPGECVEIMTGAPVPCGADAIVMVEHTRREGELMATSRSPKPGEFVNARAAEARHGQELLPPGRRLDFADIAMLATIGMREVPVFAKPVVAILSTGDEVVPVESIPADNQVRNSNAWSVAAQVALAGGIPRILPVAPDNEADTRRLIEEGLRADLLLLSGGVSAGKYDYVEPVLAALGAEFHFDRVLIQPGQPLVFGRVRGRFFFGLPGNPASTMVTYRLFAEAATRLLAGETETPLPMPRARITHDFSHKTGLTRFLPARVSDDAGEVTALRWQGSSDVAALARSNAFLVVDADRESWKQGDSIRVILK